MKKVKILLSTAAVVAIVAGAFAVKARTHTVLYTPNQANPTLCDQQNTDFIKQDGAALTIKARQAAPGACVVLSVIPATN